MAQLPININHHVVVVVSSALSKMKTIDGVHFYGNHYRSFRTRIINQREIRTQK